MSYPPPRAAPHIGALTGKVALVTGASRGVGKGIAAALGEAGATVYVTATARSSRAAPATFCPMPTLKSQQRRQPYGETAPARYRFYRQQHARHKRLAVERIMNHSEGLPQPAKNDLVTRHPTRHARRMNRNPPVFPTAHAVKRNRIGTVNRERLPARRGYGFRYRQSRARRRVYL